jgi:hypothetical protein
MLLHDVKTSELPDGPILAMSLTGVLPVMSRKDGRAKTALPLMGETPMPLMGETPMPLMGETPMPLMGETALQLMGETPMPL